METREQVRKFITTNFYVADPAALSDEMSLLDSGIIDSTGVLEIVMFIEGTFGIKVEESELLPENLESIARIVDYVTRKKSAPSLNQSSPA